ncbi:MAG TPA: PhzF family phenazine biosynthesis protein [Solirubrobacterales bacterium]|jgi:predicted PhzF superfamily epimerase YddE/YHI9|nr:PhzF family phenazine biosynthesis protein [Solirubrobacterales bacterium]
MATLHVLRVFADEAGRHGNPLGVFLDGAAVPEERRQAVAHELGFSETVFVEEAASGRCRIFTPGLELPFAGHPMVGTAWLLAREDIAVPVLRPPAGEVAVRTEGELTFVAARAEWSPPWELIELADPARIDALDGPLDGREDEIYVWAWRDETAGTVRSRCWSLADGVGEDEATGSAAIMLAAELRRDISIRQGQGSRLLARFLGDGRAEVGGRVVLEEVREFEA